MNVADLESLTLDLVAELARTGRVEDDRVEVKRQFGSDHHSVARQLGGLANAARSEWVLWLVGVDERARCVTGADGEFSNWWRSVASQFDGHAPVIELSPLVRVDGGNVRSLLFSTDRRPYVVKIPEHGRIKGLKASSEVPWREATSTRSASHEDLIRLLVPGTHLPEFEVRSAKLAHDLHGSDDPEPYWRFDCELYAVLPPGDLVVYPDHRCSVRLVSRSKLVPSAPFSVRLRASASFVWPGQEFRRVETDAARLDTIANGRGQVAMTGPGFVQGSATFDDADVPGMTKSEHARMRRSPPSITAELRLRPAGADRGSTLRIPLHGRPSPQRRPKPGADRAPRSSLVWSMTPGSPAG